MSIRDPLLRDDLTRMRVLLADVFETSERIHGTVELRLAALGMDAQCEVIGSTSPRRRTAVIDPRASRSMYPCDIDLAVFSREELSDPEKTGVLEALFPRGETIEQHGRIQRDTQLGRYAVSTSIVNPSERESYGPARYNQAAHFSPALAEEVRALRLFAMRNGLYGGHAYAFKCVAMEQAAVEFGGFEEVLERIDSHWRRMEGVTRMHIPSPIEPSVDLAQGVQPAVWRRLHRAIHAYLHEGRMRRRPYVLEEWKEDHPGGRAFALYTASENPHRTFRSLDRMIAGSLASARGIPQPSLGSEYDLFVIPHLHANEAFVSVSEGPALGGFLEDLRRRWARSPYGHQ
jgi:hypothetical protein